MHVHGNYALDTATEAATTEAATVVEPEVTSEKALVSALDGVTEQAGVTKQGVVTELETVAKPDAVAEPEVTTEPKGSSRRATSSEVDEGDGLEVISLTYGYSREGRPELKQFMLDLMCSSDGDVPFFFRTADGNDSDKAVFGKLIRDYQAQLELDTLFVADSALYSADNLQMLKGMRWLTRVPESLSEAKTMLDNSPESAFVDSDQEGYRIAACESHYAGIPQRWLIVASDQSKQRERRSFSKRLDKLDEAVGKQLKTLSKQRFACEADAKKAAERFRKGLKYHQLTYEVLPVKQYLQAGRPRKTSLAVIKYQLQTQLQRDQAAIARQQQRLGKFILASNVLDTTAYSNDDLLAEYKAQQAAERGFRFMRDPLFFTSSVFLKTPSRIMALAMIMALCLLIYTLGQRLLRHNLKAQQQSIRHQSGKQTSTPTLRWVFQLFQAVHLLVINDTSYINNLTLERQRILGFFSPSCRKYYLLI